MANGWLGAKPYEKMKRMQLGPHALLMTATIAPSPGMGETIRSDAASRLRDYCQALRWYIALPDAVVDRIVLLENSGSNVEQFRRIASSEAPGKRLELLSTSPGTPAEYGKGYAESLMIEEGLSCSKLLTQDSPFWKVTGRLRVLNLAALIRSAPASFDLYCDLRDVPLIGEALGGNHWMETRLYATTPSAYLRLFGGQAACDYVIEKGFYRIVREAIETSGMEIYPRFRRQPMLAGISGASGASYRSYSYRAKEMIRATGRLFAPWLWL